MSSIFESNKRAVFIYDGECPMCRYFAEFTELKGGIAGLELVNGRDSFALIKSLAEQGYKFSEGAF